MGFVYPKKKTGFAVCIPNGYGDLGPIAKIRRKRASERKANENMEIFLSWLD